MKQRRNGFTMFEMMIVLTMMALLVAFSLPKFGQLQERTRLTSARQEIESAIATARAAAVQKGRTAKVKFVNHQLSVTVTSNDAGTQATIVPVIPMDSVFGVTLEATDTVITFDMRGFASPRLAGTGTIWIRGATRRDSVCVTAIGQIMPRGCSL